jgi:hypothetical protein
MATKATDWDTLARRHGPAGRGYQDMISMDDRLYSTARQLDSAVARLVDLYGKRGYTAARALEMAREDCDEALLRAT